MICTILKNVADAMPLFTADKRNRGPGGRDLRTPYILEVRPHTTAEYDTVDMLIMHMLIVHKSHNASTFQDPAVVPN